MGKFKTITSLLSTDEFNYSKDWEQSDEIGRIDWLIESVKQKSQEINDLDKRIEELVSLLEKREEEIEHWKSLIGISLLTRTHR